MTDEDKGKCKEFNPEWLKAQRPYAQADELPQPFNGEPKNIPKWFSNPDVLIQWCKKEDWDYRSMVVHGNPDRLNVYICHKDYRPRVVHFEIGNTSAPYGEPQELKGPVDAVTGIFKFNSSRVHEHEHNPGLLDRKDDIPNFKKGTKVVENFVVTPGNHAAKKFDDGKIRYELLPGQALEEIAHVFTFGATKYGDFNWMDGLTSLRLFGALCRHAYAWSRGETLDKESGLHHLAHAAACCMMLVEQHDRKDLDDRVSMRKVQKDVAPQFHGSEG